MIEHQFSYPTVRELPCGIRATVAASSLHEAEQAVGERRATPVAGTTTGPNAASACAQGGGA
jgi:hypothetical protein